MYKKNNTNLLNNQNNNKIKKSAKNKQTYEQIAKLQRNYVLEKLLSLRN